ncbi:DprA winged helix domain protein [compost metagenome]
MNDILEELPPLAPAARTVASDTPSPAPEHPLLDALGFDPVSLDALSARTGWSAAQLQAKMLELELDGHVSRLPGGLFQRAAVG